MKRNNGIYALKIVVTVFIVTVLVCRVDVGALINTISGAPAKPFLIGLFFGFLAMLVSGLRWRLISHQLRVPFSVRFAVLSYMESICFNLILPGSIAGDAMRVAKVTRVRGHLRRNLAAALFDRAANVGVLLVLCIPASIFMWGKTGTENLIMALVLLSVFSLLAILVLVFSGKLRGLRRHRVIREMVYFSMMSYRVISCSHRAVWIVLLSICVQGLQVAMLACAAKSVGIDALSVIEFSIATLLALLAAALPFTVAGLGLREGVLIWTLEIYGLDSTRASAAAVVFAAILLLQAIPGFIIWMFGLAQLPQAAPGKPIPELPIK